VKLYIAGNFSWTARPDGEHRQLELDILRSTGVRNRLLTYAWLHREAERIGRGYRAAGVESIFLDSGAFSAHRSGTRIHLPGYLRCIDKLRPDVYAVLDVIGDQAMTMRNQERMERMGYHPLPVFTRGGDWGVLDDLVARYPYVALGNLVGRSIDAERRRFLDRVFATVGTRVRLHGFGVTGGDLLLDYPFYSVDSASALLSTALGSSTAFKDGRLTSSRPGARQAHLDDGIMGGQRHWQRRAAAMRDYVRLERHVTDVWKARGIDWEEEPAPA
jgi:hypothetical protein